MKRLLLAGLCLPLTLVLAAEPPKSPEQRYGALFADVQRARVFADQKTFPDCEPRRDPDLIRSAYARLPRAAQSPDALRQFVTANFSMPAEVRIAVPTAKTLPEHLEALWRSLTREPDRPDPNSSLLPLPYPYVVPGGRFREVYYWDSYFTMLGLRESGREDLIDAMLQNFAHELATYGHIPNGNRSYYLSRSQPPFFALMVELLAERRGSAAYQKYLTALETEYRFWMDQTSPTQHVVSLAGGVVLNRYYDQSDTPRPEAFSIDEDASRSARTPAAEFYRNVRSAAESGWDFSSRWFADGRSLATIETTQVVPVDLNCLLCQLERTLAKAYAAVGDASRSADRQARADARADAIRRLCWSSEDRFFFDLDLARQQRRPGATLAGVFPIFLRIASPEQAHAAAGTIRARFLRAGGVVTSLVATGQQWDAPNGWAPLQWVTVSGLDQYGEREIALEIARRWMTLNEAVYGRTGKMMEKYDVEDTTLPAGGGEYPGQDGFGWTNGVYLRLARFRAESVTSH